MVYIQSNEDRTLPHHFDCACALYGCIEECLEYKLVTFEDVCSGKFDLLIKKHCFVGSVEFMREVFSRVGLTDVRVPVNNNKDPEIITLGKAKTRASNGEKLFIKPFKIKLFTGFVLDQSVYSSLNNIPDDTIIMAYKPFPYEILSEWRCYILDGKIVDSHCYQGDFRYSPSYHLIEYWVGHNQKYLDFPRSYTIDTAVINDDGDGYTEIVEYNDMWSIGNYGIPNFLYIRLLRARYYEIMSV